MTSEPRFLFCPASLTAAGMLALFAAFGCGGKDAGAQKSAGIAVTGLGKQPVTAKEVAPRRITYTIESVGSLQADETVEIPAGVAGVVLTVNFTEGDSVASDTVLIEVDPDRYRFEVERAGANLAKAIAQEKDAGQALGQRKNLRERDAGWVTDEEIRRYETALEAASAERLRTEADLSLARKNQKDSSVKPPFRGVIDTRSVSTGAYVKAESVIATMASVKEIKLRFTVPEVDAGRIHEGQEAAFRVRTFPGEEFRARIFFVSSIADERTRSVEVKARYDNRDGRLKPGYFAQVLIHAETHEAALMVPEGAVIPTEAGFVCYIVEGGVARERRVSIGLRTEGDVEILQGLKAGESVVVRGGHTLSDGSAVEVVSEAGS